MTQSANRQNPFLKALSLRGWGLVGVVLLGVGGATAYWRLQTPVNPAAVAPVATAPVITTVTALGRLAPSGEVIKLSAPTSSQGNRVDQLLVAEGDRVKAGQVIAILDSYARLKAALAEANQQVQVAQARLAVVQAGAKQGEINAQKAEIARLAAEYNGQIAAQVATVARLQAELKNAQIEFSRYQTLSQEGAISASLLDSKRTVRDTAQASLQAAQASLGQLRATRPQQIERAKATLAQIAEVRPVDVQAAQAEVQQARAARDQAAAILEQALVRAPLNAEVLYIHTRPGEIVSSDGIVELGQTKQMQAIAEVYQSDVSQIRLGQPVRVTSTALPGELTGRVVQIGSQVRRQTIVNTDPSTNIDARVVEVHINLDSASSLKAAKFTNLQVQVVMQK